MTRTLLGLLLLVADIWAILQVVKSNATQLIKLVWIFVILFLPLVGLIVWYLVGPGNKKI